MTNIFSHGGGTQSAAITALIVQGRLPKPDFVCIVDTGGGNAGGLGEPNSAGWDERGQTAAGTRHGNSIESAGCWSDYEIIHCTDGKSRRIERATFPLVTRLPKGMVHSSDPSAPIDPQQTGEARVMRLKGYGNSIVPQVASEFVRAFMDAEECLE